MNNRYTILALVALVSVIIVADAVDRWALSYPILQSDNGDSANPGALWSLEVGRFLLAMTLVGVGALVLYRRPTLLHSTPYRVERGGIALQGLTNRWSQPPAASLLPFG